VVGSLDIRLNSVYSSVFVPSDRRWCCSACSMKANISSLMLTPSRLALGD
jgi:hypothetical protein